MALSDVLKKISEVKPFAEENVDIGPYETMPARRGRKNRALESLKVYQREYTEELQRSALFILVVGNKRNEFTSIATEQDKCFTTNPETFYQDLTNRLPPSLYTNGTENVQNIFDILRRHLEDKMLELERVNGYPLLVYRQEYGRTLKNKEEMLSLVKEALVSQIGGEIVGIQAVHSLTPQAIDRKYAAKLTPIILPTGDEKFALKVAKDLERITSRVFIVEAGETSNPEKTLREDVLVVQQPTGESVKKALRKISSQVKK